MTVESSTDLLNLLNDFGVSCDVGQTPITAIFDNDYIESLDTAGTVPLLYCRTSDVVDVVEGDTVEIAGEDNLYTVALTKADGTGLTVVALEQM